MRWFILGNAITWLGLALWCLIAGQPWEYFDAVGLREGLRHGFNTDALVSALMLVTLSNFGVALTAVTMQTFTPRRILARGTGARIAPLTLGLFVGVIGMIGATAAVYFSTADLTDAAAIFCIPALAAALTLTLTARLRPGQCIKCRYDLSGATPASKGRCPECGHDLFAPCHDRSDGRALRIAPSRH